MWKAAAGQQINLSQQNADDDEWETDPDFVNDVNEQEQRWGSNTVAGSGRTAGAIDMKQLRKETEEADALKKKKQMQEDPSCNPSFGYGGKFGVEKDRMDQCAMGHEYIAKVEKHGSQKDYSTGFGGKFGVQTDRVDKSAMSWEHKDKLVKHASQKDYVAGFGGKFGIQTDRQDKSAVGWDHVEKLEKHESQKDYAKGFGGKFGVQADRQDKSAVGWDHHEAPQKHESQTDHKIGFGGKFGLQTDRVDKSAASFNEEPARVGTNYTKTTPDIAGAKPSDLRAKFENMNTNELKQDTKSATPKKTVHARAAMFSSQETEDIVKPARVSAPKALDSSKTAFLTQTSQQEEDKSAPRQLSATKLAQFNAPKEQEDNHEEKSIPAPLDHGKLAQFAQSTVNHPPAAISIAQEIQQLRQSAPPEEEDQTYENYHFNNAANQEIPSQIETPAVVENQQVPPEEAEYFTPDEIVDTGISAIALFDYQAAADDEVSFDPDDLITHIEKIDEGWWRGLCKNKYGLFPANYVQERK